MAKKSHRQYLDKNLTRYTRDNTSFQGWRVCISRQGTMFTRYIPDRVYGGEEGAKAAAIALRDEVLAAIAARPAKEVLEEYRLKFQRTSTKESAKETPAPTEPAQPVTESVQPASETVQPTSEPAQPVSETAQPASETVQPVPEVTSVAAEAPQPSPTQSI